jgi:hypothetical protein
MKRLRRWALVENFFTSAHLLNLFALLYRRDYFIAPTFFIMSSIFQKRYSSAMRLPLHFATVAITE